MLAQIPYTTFCVYSGNGREYQGTLEHAFVALFRQNHINQKFTKPAHPQTNGKAERVIRTLMKMWHERETFIDTATRKPNLSDLLISTIPLNHIKICKGIFLLERNLAV